MEVADTSTEDVKGVKEPSKNTGWEFPRFDKRVPVLCPKIFARVATPLFEKKLNGQLSTFGLFSGKEIYYLEYLK